MRRMRGQDRILVADSGSTKTDWCLVAADGTRRAFTTGGINPYQQTEEEIGREMETVLYPAVRADIPFIKAVYFYGAGCAFPEKNKVLERAIRTFIPVPIVVESDLLGAARSLCGHEAGIACILGTGSNSCLYDGKRITEQVSPLGFILGDEGSGAVLGKLLVGDCLKRQLPDALVQRFMEEYALTPAHILERVYRQPFPNRFLAGLSRFLGEHLEEPSIYALVYESFRSFFIRNVMRYTGYADHKIRFVGSIAYYYQDVLRAAAGSLRLEIGTIERSPMEGLIRYHSLKSRIS